MPAQVDDLLAEVDTPALVIDLDLFERNLAAMAEAVRGKDVRLRPHAKSHKCPEIAKRQIAHGAIGICCQKVGEAEAFVAAGISDVMRPAVPTSAGGTGRIDTTSGPCMRPAGRHSRFVRYIATFRPGYRHGSPA